MLKIAVCDDEIGVTSKVETILKRTAREYGIQIDIDVFFDGLGLYKNIENNKTKYDLIFLDVEMKNMDGLETAKKIRKLDELVFLIYITNHKNYAIAAYEVHPFQFIVKPIEEGAIEKNLLLVYEKISTGTFYYEYKFQRDYYKVVVNDIMYFESDKRVINIHLMDGTVSKYYDKLNIIEKRMQQRGVDFWRIHCSLLVNARYIKRKAYDHIVLFDGTVFCISEDRRKDIDEQYANTIVKEMN